MSAISGEGTFSIKNKRRKDGIVAIFPLTERSPPEFSIEINRKTRIEPAERDPGARGWFSREMHANEHELVT